MKPEIGERIRRKRITSDHTQQSVADLLGLSSGAYAKIERGETDPSISRLYQIAEIFGVNVITFLSDDKQTTEDIQPDAEVSKQEFEELSKLVLSIGRSVDKLVNVSSPSAPAKPVTRARPKKKK